MDPVEWTVSDVIEKNKRCVTISLDVKFIGISKYKDILTGNVLIIKKTKSLVLKIKFDKEFVILIQQIVHW